MARACTATNRDRWIGVTISLAVGCWSPIQSAPWRKMLQDPYVLDQGGRAVVLAAIQRHCAYRGWTLLAAHVRSNPVHAIVEAETRPERIMNEFKSYASRELNRLGSDGPDRKRWARHGSTRWLWKDEDVRNALQYIMDEQGEAMAAFVAEGV